MHKRSLTNPLLSGPPKDDCSNIINITTQKFYSISHSTLIKNIVNKRNIISNCKTIDKEERKE